MNTNTIKSFAKKARLLLLEGVAQRLKYWGFTVDGSNDQTIETTIGGYIFRGDVYTDMSEPAKWNKLKKRIKTRQDIQDVVEEAAYTWFNRLTAIKVLEMNGYIPPALAFIEGQRVPSIVQNAKRGNHQLRTANEISLLQDYFQHDQDEQIFGLLITSLCNQNQVLHDVFGHLDDYTEILLPQSLLKTNGLLDLINGDGIAFEDYKEVELIGWLYQFYISDKKDEVFAGFKQNKKARAEDIPAATQIFTPKWIVQYMVENTVGKIYLDYDKNSSLRSQMKYLVGNDEAEPLINSVESLTLIDPACGSGHILVAGFELLFKMYLEEGYSSKHAVENILRKNIFGLDIDERAMQLARFAVLLKAAQFDADILKKGIMPQIYCFVEDQTKMLFSTNTYDKEYFGWENLLGMKLAEEVQIQWTTKEINQKTKKEEEKQHIRNFGIGSRINDKSLELLYMHHGGSLIVDYSYQLEMFWGREHELSSLDYSIFFYAIQLLQRGKNLGSVMKISFGHEIIEHLKTQYVYWQKQEKQAKLTFEEQSIWNTLKPMLDLLLVLCQQYTAVVANPPYMNRKNMNKELIEYIDANYSNFSSEFYAVFTIVQENLCKQEGFLSFINLSAWMFLPSFNELRENIITETRIQSFLHLGRGIFGSDFGSCSLVAQKVKPNINTSGKYFRLFKNQGEVNSIEEIEAFFFNEEYYLVNQNDFKLIPNQPIAYWIPKLLRESFSKLEKSTSYIKSMQGVRTGMDSTFIRYWHETDINNSQFNTLDAGSLINSKHKWFPVTRGGDFRKWYGNQIFVINFLNMGEEISKLSHDYRLRDRNFYFKEGISWTAISASKFAARFTPNGILFGSGGPMFFSNNELQQYSLLGLYTSKVCEYLLNFINPTINYTKDAIDNIPINPQIFSDFTNNLSITSKEISKKDWDSRETSWDFESSPLLNGSDNLRESYQLWKQEVSQDFLQLHTNEEELNRIFINIYSLAEELTPNVLLRDITILQDELNRQALEQYTADKTLPFKTDVVMGQLMSYAIGLFMGRYRLDRKGINIAHPNPTEDELATYSHNGCSIEIDDDGIIPLMGNDCAFADDVLLRVRHLLLVLWSEDTLTDNLNFIQESLGMDLHRWLTEKFWGVHTSMYKKKPIYWLFCSNPQKPEKSAFKVLVYMHRMDKYTIQKIQRSYLHTHQEHIKEEIGNLAADESSLDKAELRRLQNFRSWEIECRDYNEILKALAIQQISFDLDNGVDVNYAKFAGAVAKI